MPAQPPRYKEGGDPFADVPAAQDYLREGVQGFGDALQPSILRDIGTTLGNMNAIGGLRSGATKVALADVAGKYGAQVGAYAKQATAGGLEAGLAARRQSFQEDQAKRARKAALLKAVGSVLGAGVGFLAAGPPGAAAGSAAGGKFGDAAGGANSVADAGSPW